MHIYLDPSALYGAQLTCYVSTLLIADYALVVN
jgi:hypothetical protein